jgi:hypothetical protein
VRKFATVLAGAAAAAVLITTPASASPESRAPLLWVPATCKAAADSGTCPSESYVKVKRDDDHDRGALRTEIVLRDGAPSTTYDVWVNPATSVDDAVICADPDPDPDLDPNPVAKAEDHSDPKGPLTTDSRGRGKLRLTADSADSRVISVCVVPRLEAETSSTVTALRKELAHYEAMVIAP